MVLASAVGELLIRHVGAANYATSLFTICAAWAAGRAIRARRAMDEALERTTSLLAAERDDRARLAVAGERSRIARDLHAVVARSVAAMVVQAEAARCTARPRAGRRGRGSGGCRGRRPSGARRDAPDPGRAAPARPRRRAPGATTGRRPDLPADRARTRAGSTGRAHASRASRDRCPRASTSGSTESSKRRWPAFVRIRRRPWASHCASNRRTWSCSSATTCRGARDWPTDAMRERVLLCGGELSSEPHET